MDTIADTLRGTILSLKQISDRLKKLANELGDIPSGTTIYTSIEEINNTVYESAASIIEYLQGEDSGATNTAILEAIGAIEFDKSGLATDIQANEIISDVSGLPGELHTVLETVSGITGYAIQGSGTPEDVNLTVVDDKIGDIAEIVSAITGGEIDCTIPGNYALETTLVNARDSILNEVSGVSREIGTDTDQVTVHEKLDWLVDSTGECTFVRNNDGTDTWTLILDRSASINNNTLNV